MNLFFFDPYEITASFGGIQIKGWTPGEFIRIDPSSNDFVDVVGVYGEVTRIKTKDHRCAVTFSLMPSSLSNDLLSLMNNIDHLVPNGAGVGAFMIIDNNGRAVFRSERAWIARAPIVTFDRDPTPREWVLSCDNVVRFDGGYG